MTKATNSVARVAAAVAGLGLVAMSFAPLAGAQTATTTTATTTTTTTATFTRDLTLGSTGADVTALQTWLIAKGYSIPAGATGYFGAQTKAALAAYQAANMITPAAGYFGPITRAKVAATAGTTTGGTTTTTGGTTTTTTTLSGGEADLRNFQLMSGDDLAEGDTNSEIAVAKFDVRGGDVQVQRITVDLQPTNTNASVSQHPWDFIDGLSVYYNGKKVGDVDTGSKTDWDRETANSGGDFTNGADYYTLDIPVNAVVKEGDSNELSIHADAASNIDDTDAAQTFTLKIPTDGIRALDAAGIQDYTGNDTTTVGFNTAQNGKLNVTTSSNNPNAGVLVADDTDTSDSFDVLSFDVKNSQDADVDFNKLTFNVATSTATSGGAKNISTIIRRATLDLDGDTYTGDISNVTSGQQTIIFDNLDSSVSGNDTITGTLSVELYGQTNHFAASGETLTFSLPNANVDAESSDSGDTSSVTGSATGKKQSIAVNSGITVAGNSNSTSESYNSTTPSTSTGTFTLKFDVTANGDNDVYVPKSVVATASSTAESANPNAGVIVFSDLAGSANLASTSSSLTSTADTDPDNSAYYLVRSGDTETFTVNVTIDPTTAGYYQVGLDMVRFTSASVGGSLQSLDVDQTDSDFQTQQLYIH